MYAYLQIFDSILFFAYVSLDTSEFPPQGGMIAVQNLEASLIIGIFGLYQIFI